MIKTFESKWGKEYTSSRGLKKIMEKEASGRCIVA